MSTSISTGEPAAESHSSRLAAWLWGNQDAGIFDNVARALSVATAFYCLPKLMHASEWLTTDGFHAGAVVPALPTALVPIFVFGLFAALIAVWRDPATRWASGLIAVQMIYTTLLDPITAGTTATLVIVGWVIVLSAPRSTTAPKQAARQSAAPTRLFQITFLLYLCSLILSRAWQGHWLAHWDALWSHAQGPGRTETAAWMLRNLPRGFWSFLQGFSLLSLVAGFVCLLSSKTCRWGMLFVFIPFLLTALVFAGHWSDLWIVGAYLIAWEDQTFSTTLPKWIPRSSKAVP